ncbi:globin domain-containing protein [Paraglaciecola hydrolytica]|uniref:Globin domain-containing protein n=1 Tax=Paraglaciecola hydrolytica TaxID=1799789 RepID=A0A136A626_9ALTE|nr:globin domain-containing protein [Paraglaciecola hydrolytica]KXI30678.1 hypothetical protein AX660_04410 [Paraglaciecola hydrolytica]
MDIEGRFMILTVEEKSAIKESFAVLLRENANVAECFYNNLFELAPLIKPLFKSGRENIENHFHELIGTAVNKIDHFNDLRADLIALGKRHKIYGAQQAHFAVVKAAFILSIQYKLKGQCSPFLENSWAKYIDNISSVMIEGLES